MIKKFVLTLLGVATAFCLTLSFSAFNMQNAKALDENKTEESVAITCYWAQYGIFTDCAGIQLNSANAVADVTNVDSSLIEFTNAYGQVCPIKYCATWNVYLVFRWGENSETESDDLMIGDKYTVKAGFSSNSTEEFKSDATYIYKGNSINGMPLFEVYTASDEYTSDDITIKNTETGLLIGRTLQLNYSVTEGKFGTVRYLTSDSAVATVDGNGLITAVSAGTVKISVAYGKAIKDYTLNICESVSSITITNNEAQSKMTVGKTLQLTYDIPANTMGTAVFSSSENKIASVSESGLITAVSFGDAEISVSFGEVSAGFTVHVYNAVTQVNITNTETSLEIGKTLQLNYTLGENQSDKVEYDSSDDGIMTVDSNGLMTAVSAGNVTVTVTVGNINDTISLEVTRKSVTAVNTLYSASFGVYSDVILMQFTTAGMPAAFVDINTAEFEYTNAYGESVPVKYAQSFQYWIGIRVGDSADKCNKIMTGDKLVIKAGLKTTEDEEVKSDIVLACYNKNGVFEAYDAAKEVSEITIISKEENSYVGDTLQLEYTIGEGTFGTPYYVSSDEEIANVDDNGKITFVKAGTATISVNYKNVKKSYHATVYYKVTSVDITNTDTAIEVGKTLQLVYNTNENAFGTCIITSSDNDVATVGESGLITAKSKGSVTIKVAYGDISDEITLTVNEKVVESVSVKKTGCTNSFDAESILIAVLFLSAAIIFTKRNKSINN